MRVHVRIGSSSQVSHRSASSIRSNTQRGYSRVNRIKFILNIVLSKRSKTSSQKSNYQKTSYPVHKYISLFSILFLLNKNCIQRLLLCNDYDFFSLGSLLTAFCRDIRPIKIYTGRNPSSGFIGQVPNDRLRSPHIGKSVIRISP